jgi:hypothetical protein
LLGAHRCSRGLPPHVSRGSSRFSLLLMLEPPTAIVTFTFRTLQPPSEPFLSGFCGVFDCRCLPLCRASVATVACALRGAEQHQDRRGPEVLSGSLKSTLGIFFRVCVCGRPQHPATSTKAQPLLQSCCPRVWLVPLRARQAGLQTDAVQALPTHSTGP